jgi:hypothetical protein
MAIMIIHAGIFQWESDGGNEQHVALPCRCFLKQEDARFSWKSGPEFVDPLRG